MRQRYLKLSAAFLIAVLIAGVAAIARDNDRSSDRSKRTNRPKAVVVHAEGYSLDGSVAARAIEPLAQSEDLSEIEMRESLGKETSGYEPLPPPSQVNDPPTSPLLLVPDSTAKRVMAFDPVTGDLVNPNLVPPDTTNLATPINAVLSPDGQSILVSDQIKDVVQMYDLSGAYKGVFAPAGGPNTAILDNIRGISFRADGHLLVTVDSGPNGDSVAEFDGTGNYLGNFVANGSGGLTSPWDPFLRADDVLVPGSNRVYRYDPLGAFLNVFAQVPTFPEQVAQAANGNILVANFSPGSGDGVLEFLPNGTFVARYDPTGVGGNRGVYELPNGNILTTNGSGVYEISRAGTLVSTKITGVSARFIEYAPFEPPIVRASLDMKPGSCPNSVNAGSRGVIPAAILGTDTFDVTSIDKSTLRLVRSDGIGGWVTPLYGPPGPGMPYDDVGTPFAGSLCDCHAAYGDGFMDLVMKFDTEMAARELMLGDLSGGSTVGLTLTGALMDGTALVAEDCIMLVPPDHLMILE